MNITVIGLGLIGGSMAIDLKKRNFANKIFGVDNNKKHAETAIKMKIADEITDLDTGIKNADIIITATPLDACLKLLPEILDKINEQTVIDVCSAKHAVCNSVKSHPKRKYFVASHPMAGTEHSGPQAAVSHLFDGKTTFLCNTEKNTKKAVETAKKIYKTLNMKLIKTDDISHDIHAAFVSHISHISSFALALTVLEKEKDEKHIFNMAGGGFKSTVRLAKSSSDMWTPVLEQNAANIIEVINTYTEKLQEFKHAISEKNRNKINSLILEANKIKRII
ncbi:MAG: prephenate dehydrogenase [Chlorobi bacterium]|nr:prephenate dehydrogenase [Chlorobiota bacterium]